LNDLLKLSRNNYNPDIFAEINKSLEKLLKARDATVLTEEANDQSGRN